MLLLVRATGDQPQDYQYTQCSLKIARRVDSARERAYEQPRDSREFPKSDFTMSGEEE